MPNERRKNLEKRHRFRFGRDSTSVSVPPNSYTGHSFIHSGVENIFVKVTSSACLWYNEQMPVQEDNERFVSELHSNRRR